MKIGDSSSAPIMFDPTYPVTFIDEEKNKKNMKVETFKTQEGIDGTICGRAGKNNKIKGVAIIRIADEVFKFYNSSSHFNPRLKS